MRGMDHLTYRFKHSQADMNADSNRWYRPKRLRTFVVDLKADRAHTLIRLEMKPHLMGHAHNQVWDKTPCQPADRAIKMNK